MKLKLSVCEMDKFLSGTVRCVDEAIGWSMATRPLNRLSRFCC